MDKQALIDTMVGILQATIDSHQQDEGGDAVTAAADLALIGENASVSSMALVSFIADVESTMAEQYQLSLTLVSERALSRKKSPFRTVDALADYVLELVADPAEVSS